MVLSKNKIYPEKKVEDFKQLIEITSKEYSTNTAFTIKDNKKDLHNISFLEFNNNIKQLGTALLNLNLNSSKIGIISPDRYEWCCSYLAIATSGNIIVPLDYLLPQLELEELIKRSEIEAVIFDKKFLNLIKSLFLSNSTSLKYCICMDLENDENEILSYNKLLGTGKYLLNQGNTLYDSIKINKNAISVLIYTSGTTSKPKAVMLSQYNICSNVSAMTTLIKYQPNDSILLFLPLHHTLACMASFLFCHFIGFRLCFADSLKDIGKNMVEYGISGLVAVPAIIDIMYKQIIKKIVKSHKYYAFKLLCGLSDFLMFFHIDIRRKLFKEILDGLGGNIRAIIYGSAPSGKKVIHFFNTIGINMIQGYGLTETAPVISCQSDKYYSTIGCCGYPLFNETVKINNQSNGIGEILVKGPNVMLGYYDNPQATFSTIKDGWLYTGDLGKLDKHGRLWVTGRKKDIIILHNGKNVVPEEVESLINKLDFVSESMIYEKKDNNGSEKICAKIVYKTDCDFLKNKSQKEIYDLINNGIKNINKNLPIYSYIREFSITDEPLIKTTTQKIKRYEEMEKMKINIK